MVGVGVNVTLVPLHIELPALEDILTDGVTFAVTVIVTVLLVAVVGDAQVALLVITQLTWSPFDNVVVV